MLWTLLNRKLTIWTQHSEIGIRKNVKCLKKVHVSSLFQVVDYALEKHWSEDQFGEWAKSFLIDRYSVDSPYGQLCQKGATSKQFVSNRLDYMIKDMEQLG